jgi:uncharacterized protein (DUF924 family)
MENVERFGLLAMRSLIAGFRYLSKKITNKLLRVNSIIGKSHLKAVWLFRGTSQAFATDAQALYIAEHAVRKGYDRQLLICQRWFVYLPFEHSEELERQRQSVELFRQLGHNPDNADVIGYAIRHLEIIERFGRFPHRNEILGRTTTYEEAEFLKQPGSSF